MADPDKPKWLEELYGRYPVWVGAVWCLVAPSLIILTTLCLSQFDWIAKSTLANWLNRGTTISPFVSLYAFFVATFGLFLAGRRTQELLRQNDIAEQGQATERYTRAVEQLGHDNQVVRIGGLYGLERIAEESPKERRQALEMLVGFVRSHAAIEYKKGNKDEKGNPIPDPSKPRSEKMDVETAMKILAQILKPKERRGENDRRLIDLSATDLRDLEFRGEKQNLQRFNFRNALLSDQSNPINLFEANLTSAYFGYADLTGASLCKTTLTGSHFGYANLTGADLTGANLTGVILSCANLTGAILLDTKLTGAILSDTNLTGANLFGADLTGTGLFGVDLAEVILPHANLTGVNLEGVRNLQQSQLKRIRYKEGKPPTLPKGLVLPEGEDNIIRPGDDDWRDGE